MVEEFESATFGLRHYDVDTLATHSLAVREHVSVCIGVCIRARQHVHVKIWSGVRDS